MTPRLRTAIGIVVLIALICAWALIVDDRCSRAVSQLDPTIEEMSLANRGNK